MTNVLDVVGLVALVVAGFLIGLFAAGLMLAAGVGCAVVGVECLALSRSTVRK